MWLVYNINGKVKWTRNHLKAQVLCQLPSPNVYVWVPLRGE